MSITDKITRLTTARNNIRTAINNKGGSASSHGFEDFSSDIGNIIAKESVTWHQCPVLSKNFFNQINYTGNATLIYTPLITGTLSWSTSDSAIATVSGTNTNATITGVGAGNATITVSNGTDTETVTVNVASLSSVIYISAIANYAPATAVSSNTKPIGKTVDGVIYYNEVPNVDTPFSSTNATGTLKPLDKLRWLNTATENVRDLGGWTCDGGTVKYGMLVRGGEPVASDKAMIVDTVGIKHELQLRGTSEAPQNYSLWDIDYTCTTGYVWMNLTNTTAWTQIFRCVFDNISKHKPVYFHCHAGADRTGTVGVMLEALLGVSQSDIDKDYELTCFSTGTGTAALLRARNEDEYKNYITAIKAVPLEGGLTDSFRNRAVSFVLSLGFTIDEINAFRTAMIDGSPETITVSMDSYSVTNTLTNVTNSSAVSSVTEFQGYEAELTPSSGYNAYDVTITMGGVDITGSVFSGNKVNTLVSITKSLTHCSLSLSANTIMYQSLVATLTADSGYTLTGGTVTITMGGVDVSTYYSNGKIAIPKVTGNIVITATAIVSEITIDPNIVVGNFNHAVGDDFTTGETSSTYYSRSDVIDVSSLSWVRVRNTAAGTASDYTDIYIYYAGDDNIVDSYEKLNYLTTQDKTFTLPTGTTKIRFRGYAQFLADKDTFTITGG